MKFTRSSYEMSMNEVVTKCDPYTLPYFTPFCPPSLSHACESEVNLCITRSHVSPDVYK